MVDDVHFIVKETIYTTKKTLQPIKAGSRRLSIFKHNKIAINQKLKTAR